MPFTTRRHEAEASIFLAGRRSAADHSIDNLAGYEESEAGNAAT